MSLALQDPRFMAPHSNVARGTVRSTRSARAEKAHRNCMARAAYARRRKSLGYKLRGEKGKKSTKAYRTACARAALRVRECRNVKDIDCKPEYNVLKSLIEAGVLDATGRKKTTKKRAKTCVVACPKPKPKRKRSNEPMMAKLAAKILALGAEDAVFKIPRKKRACPKKHAPGRALSFKETLALLS